MKKLLSIVIMLGLLVQFQAQTSEILGHFTASELSGKVMLNWQIVKGQTCNGIQIYRSVNGLEFVQIGEISGVCGSSLEAINYYFTDNNPLNNHENSYRLELGGYGNSEILRKEVLNIEGEGFQIRPHPVQNESKLYFKNSKNKLHSINIYNAIGKMVGQMNTTQKFFEIKSTSYQSGVYFFTLKNEEGELLTSGKLVIQ